MIVTCKIHGSLPGILVSPDLSEKIERRLPIVKNEYVRIDFEYEGEIVDAYYLSREVADRNGIASSGVLPMTDEYPPYALEAKPQCSHCFNELTIGN